MLLSTLLFLPFLFIIIKSPVRIHFLYGNASSHQKFEFEVSYFNVIHFKFKTPGFFLKAHDLMLAFFYNLEIPVIKEVLFWYRNVGTFSDSRFRKYSSLLKKLTKRNKNVLSCLNTILGRIKVSMLEFRCDFGFEDPAITAIFFGGLHAFSHIFVAAAFKHFDLSNTEIKIGATPHFQTSKSLEVDFSGIIKATVGHIIIAAIYILRFWMSSKNEYRKTKGVKMYGRASH